MRNYNGIWVVSSSNHKTINPVNHANSIASMQRLDSEHGKARGSPMENYPPVVCSLVKLDIGEKAKKIRDVLCLS